MRPIRVLLITRASEGGVATIVQQLARGLDRHKYQPYVCLVKYDSNYSEKLRHRTDIEVIEFGRAQETARKMNSLNVASSKSLHGWIDDRVGRTAGALYLFFRSIFIFLKHQVPEIFKFIKLIKKLKIDLIHTHQDLNYSKPEIIAAKLLGVPSICHLHAYTRLNAFDLIFSHLVDCYIYISRDIERYHRSKGKPIHKGTIVYNGVELDRFNSLQRDDGKEPTAGAYKSGRRIGIIGRIDFWKGHDYFINALPTIRDRFPEFKALIVGEVARNDNYVRNRRYLESLQRLVASLKLENTVTFTGHRDDISGIMANLDILVHASSKPEPFGLVIIEGMASGKPVIATAAGGVLEIIQDNENGLLVPCQDSQAIARAIIELLTDKEKADKIAASGRKTVAEKFTSHKQIFHIENLYQRVLTNGRL